MVNKKTQTNQMFVPYVPPVPPLLEEIDIHKKEHIYMYIYI